MCEVTSGFYQQAPNSAREDIWNAHASFNAGRFSPMFCPWNHTHWHLLPVSVPLSVWPLGDGAVDMQPAMLSKCAKV